MAREVCPGRDSNNVASKTSKVRPVRVVHISKPSMVKASVCEFRSVVQSLTGQKRSLALATAAAQSSPTSSHTSEVLSADADRSLALKAAKLEDAAGLRCDWTSMSLAASDMCDSEHAEHQRPEKHKVEPSEIHNLL